MASPITYQQIMIRLNACIEDDPSGGFRLKKNQTGSIVRGVPTEQTVFLRLNACIEDAGTGMQLKFN